MVLLIHSRQQSRELSGEILKMTLRQKLQSSVTLDAHKICLWGQVEKWSQHDVFSKLVSSASTSKTSGEPSGEDIETGYALFHAVVFCPVTVLKMYTFVDDLLVNETSRTIIQTIIHLFHSEAITDATSFTLAKQFYHALANTLNLQYGNILFATSTLSQLQAMKRNDWPFFANFTDRVGKCIQGLNCDVVKDIQRNLGR